MDRSKPRVSWKSSKNFFIFKLTTRSYVFRLLASPRASSAPVRICEDRIIIHDEHCEPTGQCPAGACVVLQRMAAGSRHEDADEQPRPGGCRTAGGSRGLRRLRARREKLARLRRHRRDAAPPRARRNTRRAVRKTGRGISHALL